MILWLSLVVGFWYAVYIELDQWYRELWYQRHQVD